MSQRYANKYEPQKRQARAAILALLKESRSSMCIMEIAQRAGMNYRTADSRIAELLGAGHIRIVPRGHRIAYEAVGL